MSEMHFSTLTLAEEIKTMDYVTPILHITYNNHEDTHMGTTSEVTMCSGALGALPRPPDEAFETSLRAQIASTARARDMREKISKSRCP